MVVGWETYLERLGPQGVRLVAGGLLDEDAAARLLGRPAEGVPGPERGRALVDLVDEQPGAADAILEAFDAAAPPDTEGGAGRDEARIRDELAGTIRAPEAGAAAALLHRLARVSRPPLPAAELRAAAEVLAASILGDEGTRPKWFARSASERAGVRELEQERRVLESRVRQLEAQQGRLLERTADLEHDLARRVEEVRELRLQDRTSRDERARLEKEVARLERRIEDFNERRAREQTGVLTSALRRLTTEQRRATAQLEKVRKSLGERRDALRDQNRRVAQLEAQIERLSADLSAARESETRAREELDSRLAALGRGLRGGENPERRAGELPRVGLFVDVQNMFYAAREKNARLDFEALLAAAGEGRQVLRAVAYLVETREIDQSAFIHLLQVKKYEVKRKPLRIRPDGSMKGNWDLEIALDALSTSERVDVVVLVTGDGDFIPLVRQLRLSGVTVEVYGFPRSSAPDLREAADRFVPITRKLLRPLAAERRPRPAAQPDGAKKTGDETPSAEPASV